MITTDCWSWKSLQHLLVKLQVPTSSAPSNPGLTSKLLCEKELQTRYCNMLSPKFLAAQSLTRTFPTGRNKNISQLH
jgi:hypothetical protein